MCGIACVLNDDPARPVEPGLLKRMSDRIAHRGPDGEGFHMEGPVGLASRRLAIIDLTTGQQPITDEDGATWLVFNGEIYNFPELREELQRRGHHLRTRSDTETIVHLYQDHGDDLVRHLRGMFAFALWDSRRRRLLLARDRVGKKPLYYARAGGAFVAGSEIKAVLEHPGVDTAIDQESIDRYLSLQSIPAPHTIYRGVRKLPPAHLLVVENGRVEIRRYWQVPSRAPLDIDETQAKEEILRLLREAVRMRMISDVPLGAFLSGGIDSSLVVALMQEVSSRPVKTFSIGFEEKSHSELPYAREVARHVGTDHREFIVRPDALDVLPRLVRAYDEPFGDSSGVPSYYVARETRRHVTVALNGDGGDEAFGGYLRYLPHQIYRCADRLPGPLRRALASAASLTRPLEGQVRLVRRANGLLRRLAMDPFSRYADPFVYFNDDRKRALYTPEFARAVAGADALAPMRSAFLRDGAPTLLDRILAADLESYLPDTLLVKMDIATMANSLEARSPFLDHVLIEFAARLPARYKVRGLKLKYILKQAAEGILPPSILARGKQGFAIPAADWFRGDLRAYATDLLLGPRALRRGYFREAALRRLMDEHLARAADHAYRLWALVMLELWHRIFVDREAL
jgi:asparagine synthase (glutamine-hydrolysing)